MGGGACCEHAHSILLAAKSPHNGLALGPRTVPPARQPRGLGLRCEGHIAAAAVVVVAAAANGPLSRLGVGRRVDRHLFSRPLHRRTS